MKWKNFYQQLVLESRDLIFEKVLAAIARGDGFQAVLINVNMLDENGEVIEDEKLDEEPSIDLGITQIKSALTPGGLGLRLIIKTTGYLPTGVLHGEYELTFEADGVASKLPAKMFVDEEVPAEFL